jgi:tetratricopeptide (TPR) repeat protein
MSTAAKLKKRAIELEQKKQLDKALALYVQFLEESGNALDDADVPLYNRVGDLMLRTGNVSDALSYYEKAVDMYAERGFHNNAIALCNKVLRQAPGRASIYYKLGRISATKGFKTDAKKNFLEYADRMQKAGQINEAFRALKEFADLCPDQDDIRLMLAEQLSKENRQDEALEQLQKLHDRLDSEGRMAEARATADRMKSIDPEAVPRVSGSYRPQKSNDLIFLDTSFEQQNTRPRQPAPPPSRQVSDPDLVVLTLGDQPDTPISPAHNAAVADAFSLDITTPDSGGAALDDIALDDDAEAPNELPMLDVSGSFRVGAPVDDAPGDELLITDSTLATSSIAPSHEAAEPVASDAAFDLPSDVDGGAPDIAHAETGSLGVGAQADPPPVDLIEPSIYVSGAPLGVDYAADLAAGSALESDASGSDLFDFRSPPRSDDFGMNAEPAIGLDPDVAFPSLDFDDVALPSADDVTSGAGLAAALAEGSLGTGNGIELDGESDPVGGSMHLPPADEISFQADPAALIEEAIGTRSVDASGEGLGGIELEWPASLGRERSSVDSTAEDHGRPLDVEPVADLEPTLADDSVVEEIARDVTDDVELVRDVDVPSGDEAITARHTAATSGESLAIEPTPTRADIIAPRTPTPALAVDPFQARRERAERLLEAGDRAAGIAELEVLSSELEAVADLERALTIVDELIRLSPDSIRHHQKRVELAFRASHRPKLIDAYIDLGDALFRSGEERKALVVYQRVLELAPDDARARVALDSVRSASPPAGSDVVSTPATVRQTAVAQGAPARPPAPPAQHPARSGNGLGAQPPATRKPSPLDRSAASSDFVDLGDWLRAAEAPKSTRMVAEEKPPTGDEQADFQEMLKRFKQGVADNVDDEDYESHYDLGVAYKEMGLIDEAVAEFQKALRGTHHRVRSYEALGQCFVEKEQFQVASSVLSRAMALGEGDDHHLVGVLYLMGRATEALDRPSDALDYYQRVFAVDIEFRDVAERISAIARKAT